MNKLYFKAFILTGLVSFLSSVTYSQVKPIATDRPDQTETPSIVPKKYFQMETGFLYEKINSASRTYLHPTILSKYGVNENFELRLITEFVTDKTNNISSSGLSPVIVGVKAKLSEQKGIFPATSFIGHISLPKVASEDFKATFVAPEFRFAMQHTLSDKVNVSYNLGAEWDGESPEPTFIYTLSSGFS